MSINLISAAQSLLTALQQAEPSQAATKANVAATTAPTSFSAVLSEQTPARKTAPGEIRSGQFAVVMHRDGQRIQAMRYYSAQGELLTSSGFYPQDILRQCDKFGIPLDGLKGLGQQLDAAGVAYRPYEQYAGTGCDHGIDFDNLIAGGLGSAYDWTVDPLVAYKGPSALQQLTDDQTLANKLGIQHVLAGTKAAAPATTAVSRNVSASGAAPVSSATSASTGSAAVTTDLIHSIQQLVSTLAAAQGSPSAGALGAADPASAVGNSALSLQMSQLQASIQSWLAAQHATALN